MGTDGSAPSVLFLVSGAAEVGRNEVQVEPVEVGIIGLGTRGLLTLGRARS